MEKPKPRKVLDDWGVIARLLPEGWEEGARSWGALRRSRGVPDARALLRTLLVHVADGCSLVETALRAREAGWCQLSSVALFKRLQRAEQWLRWLAEAMWRGKGMAAACRRRVYAVDATLVQEEGRTGSQWRVHFSLNLANLQCEHFELTDVGGGETFRRVPVRRGDLILGDRAYGTGPGVGHVVAHGGDVLVRINLQRLPLFIRGGQRLPILSRLRKLRVGHPGEWTAYVHDGDLRIEGRLVAIRRSRQAARWARKRLKRKASLQQKTLSREAREAAGYVFVWTTLPADQFSRKQVLDLYRLRWQIELAFKRMKSIMGLGQLPKRADASARAWLHGKLFVALLLERLLEEAETFSPWGYPLSPSTKPVARNTVYVS
jgi:hypothetical protein